MKETRIRLNMDDVHDFVKAATKCDFDIDVRYNRFLVDAKSILGVLSMDLGQILIVKCHGENSDFDSFLENIKLHKRSSEDWEGVIALLRIIISGAMALFAIQ